MKKKVVLGMSGGVDSSVAAYVLKEQGYDVIGITLSQVPHDEEFDENAGGCCSLSSVLDAKVVAHALDIPHYVINFRDIFEKKVISYFVDEYLQGRTPNPCLMCNKYIRFDKFLDKALGLGADYLATGHYAIVDKDNKSNRYLMKKSADNRKDQTYFLHTLNQYQLSHTLFPLGGYTKDKVREIAEKAGLYIHNKPDSEEICFIPDNNHGGFIEKRAPEKVKPGNFVDNEGNVLGQHKGIAYYTIGQRKGLGVATGQRVFVQRIDSERNEIVLGMENGLYHKKLYAEEINLIPFDSFYGEMEVTAKIRHTMRESKAIIKPYNEGVIVEFEEPQRAITKSQAVVFYQDDIVIGGGIIREVLD
ncbi:tRNA 2-thiouridine(34) synthase MnmA [Tissierella sp. Yu-01]|uniref:tRNA 2-thiouridine(34) synthase MnmA n=1 Tax=Tissierella sp. Yu-01 TaxID=3035694 RepID=UPI00240D2EC1|nr:tRNA 2-thiouridine(34) synthase MnmA [Tissierella sp. Yu-01]WFA10289.1 tRNA 2-thiouridine(34) synthase MnmA [Tissierella sp. Yu-01]